MDLRGRPASPWSICLQCSRVLRRWCGDNERRITRIQPRRSYIPGGCRERQADFESQKILSKALNRPARTRFAPSPTGYLHLGSLRTAVFNYLLAKRSGGQFLLRLEDTDQKRVVSGAEEQLYKDLTWAGLQWDEGPSVGGPFGPYRQSERSVLYQQHAEQLLRSRHAYRCFCSRQRLRDLAEKTSKLGETASYDRACERLTEEEIQEKLSRGDTYTVRLRAPERGYPLIHDMVYGGVRGANSIGRKRSEASAGMRLYDDPVLLKSDGLPTYHLANVVDDHLMQITHVVRGTEWLTSTARHLALYEAFDWQPPAFAHVGLLVDPSGQKLSKRNQTTSRAELDAREGAPPVTKGWNDIGHEIRDLRAAGILPEALVNFVALLGWSHKEPSDSMTLPQLVDAFTPRFTKGNAKVGPAKLWHLQKHYAAQRIDAGGPLAAELVDQVLSHRPSWLPSTLTQDEPALLTATQNLLAYDKASYRLPEQFWERNRHFFSNIDADIRLAVQYFVRHDAERSPDDTSHISAFYRDIGLCIDSLGSLSKTEWTLEAVTTSIEAVRTQNNPPREMRHFYGDLRRAVAASKKGPGMAETLVILGRDETLRRLGVARAAFEA